MGEAPWRVTVSGAPSLDNLGSIELLPRDELERRVGLKFDDRPLLVTYHPVTLQYEQAEQHATELIAALSRFDFPIVITRPNADTNGRIIIRLLDEFAADRSNVRIVDNLGTQAYFSLMQHAAAMVGNSSSGIIEAACFELPVVNIGIRQQGRTRSGNVIDVGEHRDEIVAGIQRGLNLAFRSSLKNMINVYGCGRAAGIIAERLKSVPLDESLTKKQFHDFPVKRTDEPTQCTAAPAA
jgi:UDP-hydrolysing UDP-N-acetyl-D-glucosamine 2-epimerase